MARSAPLTQRWAEAALTAGWLRGVAEDLCAESRRLLAAGPLVPAQRPRVPAPDAGLVELFDPDGDHVWPDGVQPALDTACRIGIATGMLMARHRMPDAEAFGALRAVSRHSDRSLGDVAEHVITTGTLPDW